MSGAKAWRPDPALVASARAVLAAALEGAAGGAAGEGPAFDELFEAAGRLVALGAPELAAGALRGRDDLRAPAAQALGRDEAADELEDAAIALREALAAGDEGEGAGVGVALAAFAGRDRAEFRLLGAALALGRDPERFEAGAAGRLEFEALVRPELWRLCAFNDARRAALAAVTPALRARFWWWHEGAEIDPGAAAALPAVAALVAAFPAARARLEALVRAREAWGSSRAARAASPRPMYTLRDWVERRDAGGPGLAEAPALAAAAADETLLVDEADYQISWAPPDELVVDLVADRAPGELPALRLAEGPTWRAVAVEGAEERFAFSLPPGALDEARASLTLPLARGPIEVALPPPRGEHEG